MEIRTRNDLIAWLEDNAPYPRIKRALVEGTNENLGGFSRALPYTAGWIVKIKGKKKEWIVVIVAGTCLGDRYMPYIINKVPWNWWEGDKSKNLLYQGDNPEEYRRLRDAETKK